MLTLDVPRVERVATELPALDLGLPVPVLRDISLRVLANVAVIRHAGQQALEAMTQGASAIDALTRVEPFAMAPALDTLVVIGQLSQFPAIQRILAEPVLSQRIERHQFDEATLNALKDAFDAFNAAGQFAAARPQQLSAANQSQDFIVRCMKRQVAAMVGNTAITEIRETGQHVDVAGTLVAELVRVAHEQARDVRHMLEAQHEAGEIPLSFFDTVGPPDPTGAVRKAVLDERERGY